MMSLQELKNYHIKVKHLADKNKPLINSSISILLFIILFVALFPATGRMAGSLITIPIIVIAWYYGTKQGIIAGILGSLLTFLLEALFVLSDLTYDPIGKLISILIGIVVGGGIGWLNSIRTNLKSEIVTRQMVETQLNQNELKFQTLVTVMGEGLCVVDNHGILSFTNEAFDRLLGFEHSQLIGKPITDFLTPDSITFLHNLPELSYIRTYSNAIFEVTLIRKDTIQFIAKISLSDFSQDGQKTTGYLAVVTDISAYKLNEQLLTESRDYFVQQVSEHSKKLRDAQIKLEAIIETIPDGIIVLSTQGDILLVNNSCKQLFEELFKEKLPNHATINNLPNDILTKAIKELLYSTEEKNFVVEISPGSHIRLQSVFIKSIGPDNISGIIIQLQDISTYVEIDKFRKHIITTVSHELRTPLSVVSLSAHNLQKFEDELSLVQRKRIIDGLVTNANTMNTMIEDLLTLEKFSSKSLIYNSTTFKVSDTIENVLLQLNPRITEKSITVVNESLQEITFTGDQFRIEQVCRIVLDNAIKYSSNNSILTIQTGIQNSKLAISDQITNNKKIFIAISDQGTGIPKIDLPFIFEKFYRSKEVEHIQGSGIGLALAKEIITYHGGTISIHPNTPKGTKVIIELPFSELNTKR